MLAEKEEVRPKSLPASSEDMPRRRQRRKLNGMVWISLTAFVILSLGLTYVGQRVHVMNLGYELAALEQRLEEAAREQEFLMLSMAQARSLDRVEQLAIAELGMKRPNDRQYVVLEREPTELTTFLAQDNEESRGILNAAIAWVTRHWPRVQTAEAGRVDG